MSSTKEKNSKAISYAGFDKSSVDDSFSSKIYFAITDAFASNNPKQMFCLSWPGTVLSYDRLAWDKEEETAGNMPERALVRTSQILDMYVPPSPITQPDGTRVSDRYEIALDAMGPMPNTDLLELQEVIRERLRTEIKKTVDGEERTFTLVSWFDYLYTQWTSEKQEWANQQNAAQNRLREEFKDDEEKYWDAYLKWYEENADSYIHEINSKWDQLLIEFPLTEWQDAVSILDTKDDGGLHTAKQLMNNVRLPLPRQEGGIDYVPTNAVPYDWALELKPTTKHIDMLSDPLAQKMALDNAINKLQNEVFNWMAILPQVTDEQFKESARKFDDAVSTFTSAQSALIKTYSDNIVLGVRVYADVMGARGNDIGKLEGEEQGKTEKGIQGLISVLNATHAAGAAAGKTVNWDDIKKIAEAFGQGQETLIGKQEALIKSGVELANAANLYLQNAANRSQLPWLAAYAESLRNKLDELKEQQQRLSTAANVYYKYASAETDPEADPNTSPKFGENAFPATVDDPMGDRWTEIRIDIDESQMTANSSMNSYFQQHQWGVDFFIGSAGGTSQYQYSNFASKIMKKGSKIQIGFLATKVMIQRPWMRPEIFANTKSFFRTLDKPLAPNEQVTQDKLLDQDHNAFVEKLVHDYAFPAYPVAMLLVKDVTIKVQVEDSQIETVRNMSKSISSQGGGFFCFSISDVQTSQSQNEKVNSYCMAGQMVAKAPAPQVLGYWVQLLPPDESTYINKEIAGQIAQAIGFVNKLQEIHGGMAKEFKKPFTVI